MPYGTDPVILGTAPAGSDGDTAREAFTKVDAALNEIDDLFDGTEQVPNMDIGEATVERYVTVSQTLTPGGTVNIDFDGNSVQRITLNADTTFTTSNRADGKTVTLHITCDSTQRNLTFPDWGGADEEFFSDKPTFIPANKKALLVLYCNGDNDSDVDAAYALRGASIAVTTNGAQTLTNKTIPLVVKVASSNYTVGTDNVLELYGGVIYASAAITLTLPAAAAGQSFTVQTIGNVAVSVDPNASDLIYLDGTALSDGDKITNLSTAGDIAVFTYYDATGWYASTNGWTDGN